MSEPKLKAVILDWAGTIVDHGSCAPAAAFVELFERNGVTITVEQARGPMGTQKRDHIMALLAEPDIAAKWSDAHNGAAASEQDVDRLYQEFSPLQIAILPKHSQLIPGTLDAIAAFRERGLKIGTGTGYSRPMMEVVVEAAESQGFEADAVVTADDVPAGRPAPWLCFENAQRLNVYPMWTIVKVGDTVPDVLEGINAGAWSVAVARTGNEVGLSEADLAALPENALNQAVGAARERLAAQHSSPSSRSASSTETGRRKGLDRAPLIGRISRNQGELAKEDEECCLQ
jgi:phosphonoacetaldehyde hydrolase